MLPWTEDEAFVCLLEVAPMLHGVNGLCGAVVSLHSCCTALRVLQCDCVHAAWSCAAALLMQPYCMDLW